MSLFIRTAPFSVYVKPRTLFATLITYVAWRERKTARLYDAHLWKHDWLSINLLLKGFIFGLGLSLFKIEMGKFGKRIDNSQVDQLLRRAIVHLKISLGCSVCEATSTDFVNLRMSFLHSLALIYFYLLVVRIILLHLQQFAHARLNQINFALYK